MNMFSKNSVFLVLSKAAELMDDKAEAYTTLAEEQMAYIMGSSGRR